MPRRARRCAISGLKLDNGNSGTTPGGAIEDLPGSGESAPLTLTNDVISGSTTTATGSQGGGGVYSRGPVTISGSTITGNKAASGAGGGILVEPSTGTSSNKYDLTITDSTISGNTALDGGGIAGSNNLIVTGSQITGNHATSGTTSDGDGGGIYREPYSSALETTTTITNTAISGNTATNVGGGMLSSSKYGTTILNSSISGNTAHRGGGIEVIGAASYPQRLRQVQPHADQEHDDQRQQRRARIGRRGRRRGIRQPGPDRRQHDLRQPRADGFVRRRPARLEVRLRRGAGLGLDDQRQHGHPRRRGQSLLRRVNPRPADARARGQRLDLVR